MSSVFNLYVVAEHRLPVDLTDDAGVSAAVKAHGARWAQIEGKAIGVLGAWDEIGAMLGSSAVHGMVGALKAPAAASLHTALSAASADALARIDADARLSRAYWALRDTAEEASQRGAALVIVCDG